MRRLTDEEAAILIKVAHGVLRSEPREPALYLPYEEEPNGQMLFVYDSCDGDGMDVAELTTHGKEKLKEYLEDKS